jgi:hypothetical protein
MQVNQHGCRKTNSHQARAGVMRRNPLHRRRSENAWECITEPPMHELGRHKEKRRGGCSSP